MSSANFLLFSIMSDDDDEEDEEVRADEVDRRGSFFRLTDLLTILSRLCNGSSDSLVEPDGVFLPKRFCGGLRRRICTSARAFILIVSFLEWSSDCDDLLSVDFT